MISTRTTFIIGAGASERYGLPLGFDLLRSARELSPASPLVQLLYTKFGIDEVSEFIADLNSSPVRSLDKFLQDRSNRPRFVEIGKYIIAGLMGLALNRAGERPNAEDWIEEVLHRMAEGVSSLREFEQRNTGIQFVTFNFEMNIEDRVRANLKRRYPHEDGINDVAERTCPVHHVHGRLLSPPKGEMWSDLRGPTPSWIQWLDESAAAIRIVHDADVDHYLLSKACGAVTNAKVIVYLGLHYHPENLERLCISGTQNPTLGQSVFGSAYKLSPGECDWVREHVAGIRLGDPADTCLDVLNRFNWRL
jgi:hypothetical protein